MGDIYAQRVREKVMLNMLFNSLCFTAIGLAHWRDLIGWEGRRKASIFFQHAESTACYANAIFGLVLRKKKSQTPVENKKTKKKHTQHACEVTWRVLKKNNLTFNDNTSFRIITKLWKVNVKWVNSTLFSAGARSSYMDYGISWIGLLSIWHDLEFIQSSK